MWQLTTNSGNTVNFQSFNALIENWGRTDASGADEGDFNGDGKVNSADFDLLLTNFGRTLNDLVWGDWNGDGVVDELDDDLGIFGDQDRDGDSDSHDQALIALLTGLELDVVV